MANVSAQIMTVINYVLQRDAHGHSLMAKCFLDWTRPVLFILFSLMMVYGFWYPVNLAAFFKVVAIIPTWIEVAFFIILGGHATERVIKQSKEK